MHDPEHSYRPEPQSHESIASERVDIERKKFFLDLKENARGRVFKITEDVGGRRDTLMLPAEAAAEFLAALQRIVDYEATLPPAQ
jgi:hypothetical protein